MRTDIDATLQERARRQHGLFSAEQVVEVGGDRMLIGRRVRAGRWERLSSRVFGVPGVPNSFLRRLSAAQLHDPATVISHTAGAKLQAVVLLPSVRAEITTGYSGPRQNPFAQVHRSVDLGEQDIVIVDGLRTTSLARTVADLLTVLSRQRVERIVDDLLSNHRLTIEDLIATHDRYARGGRPTTVALREIIAARGPGYSAPGSVLESMVLDLIRREGLPLPECQAPLPGWGDGPALADMAWPTQRVIAEMDGRRWHDRDAAHDTDRERDNAAILVGWSPFRFTHRHVTTRPEYVVATLRAALTQRVLRAS